MLRVSWLVTVCLFTICLSATTGFRGAALAAGLPTYSDPEQANERVLSPLLSNDRPSFLQIMTAHFSEQGKQIDAIVFNSFLTEGELFEYHDLLLTEKLGATLERSLYALRTSKNDFLFIRISLAKSDSGWVIYDLDIKSDLSALLPAWDSP